MHPIKIVTKRLLISLLAGLVLGTALGEIPFLFLRETARAPKEIVLTIPAGTSKQIARGEQPPSIPSNMTFVVGDTLIVNNQDTVDHKLGPLWIPPNSSAQLSLNQQDNFAYECTFQAGNYFGLDVREPLTLSTRIYGILYAGIPIAIMIALYSLAMPVKQKENVTA